MMMMKVAVVVLMVLSVVAASSSSSSSSSRAAAANGSQPCKTNKDCRIKTTRCVKHSRKFDHGFCSRPRRTIKLGDACMIDAECKSKQCSGDLLIGRQRRLQRGKSRFGHCEKKGRRTRDWWMAVKSRVFGGMNAQFRMMRKSNQVAASFQGAHRIIGYYFVKADHWRTTPIRSRFTGHIRMVRVDLPKSLPAKTPEGVDRAVKIATEIGDVWSFDHKYFSVDAFNAKFVHPGDKKAVRVHLIAPARFKGSMFAAVCELAAYDSMDAKVPYMYAMGAGMAAGSYHTYYAGRSMTVKGRGIHAYVPTPFTVREDLYDFSVKWDGDEPTQMQVISTHQGETEPYITVTARMTKYNSKKRQHRRKLVPKHGFIHAIEAVSRVLTLAKVYGIKMMGVIQPIGAWVGRHFIKWQVNPWKSRISAKAKAVEQARNKRSNVQAKAHYKDPNMLWVADLGGKATVEAYEQEVTKPSKAGDKADQDVRDAAAAQNENNGSNGGGNVDDLEAALNNVHV